MPSYASAATFKTSFGIPDVTDDTAIQRCLDAATEWITQHCGRTFATAASETREYRATDPTVLDVADLATVASVKVDTNDDGTYETTLDASDYWLEPYNVGTIDVLGQYQRLRIRPTSSRAFSVGRLVEVVGTFGFGSVPKSIEQACLLLANRLWKRQESPFGVIEAPESGVIARIAGKDADVLALLEPYRATSTAWVVV